jgi:hypothetical protein
MSGSPETTPVTSISFPALPAIEASPAPAHYILNGGAAMCIGESIDYARRLRDHCAADSAPCPDGVSSSTTSSID